MGKSLSKDFTVNLEHGLHLRPLTVIVKSALKYKCDVLVENLDQNLSADGKSVFALLLLNATRGTNMRITTDGEDCAAAMVDFEGLIKRDFEEE